MAKVSLAETLMYLALHIVCWCLCGVCLSVPFFGNLVVAAIVSLTGSYLIGIRAETVLWPTVFVVILLMASATVGKVFGSLLLAPFLMLLVEMITCSVVGLKISLNYPHRRESIIRG